ncbi:MAG TPA: UDP-3-O-(3-hydroxymyristoyl)glucosamine N-acyltransferase, partial [Burkholderiaceae bacterium]|nr:UDP-3-O-(3-hydroxymyristoyl)glucosamine N-acyltransferase [Burkholderiaceae bacterium]
MPVLLAPEQAPTLHELLAEANTVGLDCKPADTSSSFAIRIRGLGSLLSAGQDEISFLSNPRLHDQLLQCQAAAVIMTEEAYRALPQGDYPYRVVLCSQPYLLYALLAQWFDQHRLERLEHGIHPSAIIADSAVLEEGVSVGPHCVVEAGARLGAGTRLGPMCVVGANSVLGRDCLLHARVTLYHGVIVGDRAILHSGCVLGADGFGFAPDPRQGTGGWAKIAQIGGVVIGDDVEIGANTTVDRGALENTTLG